MLESFSDGQILSVLESFACAAFVVDVDADGGFRYLGINSAFTATTGVATADIAGRRPHDILSPTVADEVCANYRRCIEARGPIHYEEHLRLAHAGHWWSTSLKPVVGADGRVRRIFGTAFDITGRKEMEAELLQSRGFLQTVIDSLPFPIFCKDAASLRYVFVNQAMAPFVGADLEAAIGKDDYELYSPEQAATFQASDRAVLASGGPLLVQLDPLPGTGGQRIFRTRKMLIRDAAGVPKWLLGMSEDETERRRSDDAIRATRDFLEATLDHIPAMIFCKEVPDLRYTLLNRTGEYYFGLPREQVIGRVDQELYPPERAAFFHGKDLEVLATGGPVTVMEDIQTVGGPRRMRTTKVAIPGPDGGPRHVLGIAQDVTEAHKAEARLRDAIDSLRDGFVLFDRDDRVVLHNSRFLEFYPYLRAMLPLEGRTFQECLLASREWRRDVMPEDEIEHYFRSRLAHWRDGTYAAFEQKVPGDRWVLVSERPTAEGGIVGIHTDITAQKQAEIRLVDAIESIDQGFILADTDDRVILSNRRIRELFPSIGGQMVPGAEMRDLIVACAESGDFRTDLPVQETVEMVYRLYRTGTVEGMERQLRDGRWILFSQHVTPNGLRVGLRSDITLLKVRQQQLTEIRDHLQRQAAELMRMTGDLRLARQRAEDASRAKSQFLAMISHELRTPFTGIRGMADLLAETGLAAEQVRYLDVMRRSIDRLLTLLDQVLDFSRIEAGRIDLTDVRMSPARLVADAVATFAPGAEAKGIAFDVAIAPDVPAEVMGDPAKTTQVLANLVGNAVKFTEAGAVTISLSVECDGDRAFLDWTVEDTGIGLSPNEIARLFEPFTQADDSTSRRFGGTGLGLAISKRLAEAMGGSIGVASTAGRGSRFWFRTLLRPAQPLAGDAAGVAAAETTPPPAMAGSGGPRRVLVAEDDAINQMLIDTMLKRWGYDTVVAGDGRTALERLGEGGFDAVLMDVNMPVMDGPTAVRRMRANGGGDATLPVFALTADVLPEHISRFREAGFTDVLTKPVDWARLRALLDELPVRTPR